MEICIDVYDFLNLMFSKIDYHKQGNAPSYQVCNLSGLLLDNIQVTDTTKWKRYNGLKKKWLCQQYKNAVFNNASIVSSTFPISIGLVWMHSFLGSNYCFKHWYLQEAFMDVLNGKHYNL